MDPRELDYYTVTQDPDAYKAAKEAFVSGSVGSSTLLTLVICLFLPLSSLFRNLYAPKGLTGFPAVLCDIAFMLTPIILSVTLSPVAMIGLFMILCIACALRAQFIKKPKFITERGVEKYFFVTEYRCMAIIATCVSILAVDFPAYDRSYVKAEEYGTALMDLGTGSIIFANALVSRQARGGKSWIATVLSTISGVLPMVFMGCARFVTHQAINYQEHVTEYGTHWNFFLSLSVVSIFAAAVALPPGLAAFAGVCTAMGYEAFLVLGGGAEYVMTAPRVDFFSANREGILGCLGYFSIWQFGIALKPYITKHPKELGALGAVGVIIADMIPVSRRLANFGYVFWVLSHNVVILAVTYMTFLLHNRSEENAALKAIDFNQFPYFMISNLVTGAINLSIFTLFVSDLPAIIILVIYQAAVIGLLHVFARKGIKVKFW